MAVPLFIPGAIRRKVYKTRQTFEKLNESEIREHCGVPAWGARELIELYDQLEGQISTAVPVNTKVLVFLSQLRSGSFQRIVGGVCGVSRSTVSRIIEECANFTLNNFATSINFPTSVAGINKIKQDYYEVAHLPNVVGVVDADSGYAAESKLLVPFRDTTTVPQQQQFNRALKKTRSGVERTIGNWKCRFRSMDKTGGYSCYRPSKVCKLIVSSVALHNICVTHQIPILEEDEYYRDFAIIPNLQDHPQVPPPQGPFNSTAATTRDEIAASLQSHVVPEKTGRRPNFSEDELIALATAVKDRDNIITGQFEVPEPTSRDEDSMDLLHEYETHDVPQSLVTQEQPTAPDLVLAAAAVADASEAANLGDAAAHYSKAPPGSTINFETPKRKHRRLEVSPTEQLLREQVGLMKKQVDIMSSIKELMMERNRIEQEKLELKKRKLADNLSVLMSND
ncbi:putative nuclease HARBI1 [Folsomia candida]|uniref:Putative nuclease HARBI1 n=1 Tax=Folsomia candida TaxID=158441 RepID=A0A226D831_FOLCA|nr:putative nuclease HARBI1 [Folsomia candida]